jgi:hypothetical protein
MTSQNARWAEGMEWTMRYLNKHGLKKGSSFEVRVKYADDVEFKGKVGNKIERKTDLQVCPNGPEVGGCTYFEFKSVKEVPPPNFNDQFVKDLLNGDVKRLSQIKWTFDGEKIKKADLEALKNRIDALDIPDPVWKKFGMSSAEKLKEKLKSDVIFNDIFKVE